MLEFKEANSTHHAMEPLSRVQMLLLTHATVVVSNDKPYVDYYHDGSVTERWTVIKTLQVADKLRSELLDPRGNKLVAEHSKAKRSRGRKRERTRRSGRLLFE